MSLTLLNIDLSTLIVYWLSLIGFGGKVKEIYKEVWMVEISSVAVNRMTEIKRTPKVNNNAEKRGVERDAEKLSSQTTGQQAQAKNLSEEDVISAIESANEGLEMHNRHLKFAIHDDTKEIMVKVIDSSTEEVVREIPPEKILDMVAKMWELAGIVLDKEI